MLQAPQRRLLVGRLFHQALQQPRLREPKLALNETIAIAAEEDLVEAIDHRLVVDLHAQIGAREITVTYDGRPVARHDRLAGFDRLAQTVQHAALEFRTYGSNAPCKSCEPIGIEAHSQSVLN